jgi:hypothetical protein
MNEAETVAVILRGALANLGWNIETAQNVVGKLTSHTERDDDNEQTREIYGLLDDAQKLIHRAGGILYEHGMDLTLKPGEGPYLMEHIESIAFRGSDPEEVFE